MLQICKDLFEGWNASVRYCHWKSNEHLMQGLDGDTDLDVFVLPEDKETAERHLRACKYVKFRTQQGSRYPNVDEWIGFDYETGRLVHVHLHYQIITGTKYVKEYVFPVSDEIIETRIKDSKTDVYVTHPELEAIILFCRIALKSKNKKHIKPNKDSQKEIDYIKTYINKSSLTSLCERIVGSSGSNLCEIITKDTPSTSDWYYVYKIADNWLSMYRKHNRIASKIIHLYNYYRVQAKRLLNEKYDCCFVQKKKLPNKGLTVCFVGADGSGKSTVTKELCEWLTWKISAKRFYMGSGDGYKSSFKALLRTIRKKTPKKSNESSKISRREKIVKPSLRAKLAMLVLALPNIKVAKRAYKQACRAHKYAINGSIAMLDRFPQIQFEGIYDGPKVDTLAKKIGGMSIISRLFSKIERYYLIKAQSYQPDLVFKLILPPEESLRRKPFENIEAVTIKASLTSILEFKGAEVFDIDATQDYNQEILMIKRKIWKKVLEKQL